MLAPLGRGSVDPHGCGFNFCVAVMLGEGHVREGRAGCMCWWGGAGEWPQLQLALHFALDPSWVRGLTP